MKNERYLFEGEDQMTYMTVEDVDPRDYDPQHANKGGATAWGSEDMASVNRGIQALKDDPYAIVIDDTPVIKYKNPLNQSLGIYSISVKVQHWKRLIWMCPSISFIITYLVDMGEPINMLGQLMLMLMAV